MFPDNIEYFISFHVNKTFLLIHFLIVTKDIETMFFNVVHS